MQQRQSQTLFLAEELVRSLSRVLFVFGPLVWSSSTFHSIFFHSLSLCLSLSPSLSPPFR